MSKAEMIVASLVVFLAGLGTATPARADVIRVTSGFVDAGGPFGAPWDSEGLALFGSGLSFENSLEDDVAFVQLAARPTAAQGAVLDLSGRFQAESPGSFTSTISFDASPTHVDCSNADGFTQCSASAPFTFRGNLTLTPFGGGPVVSRDLVGAGTAQARLSPLFQNGDVFYTFAASPTPEPATLSLFAAGALMAGARAWRRRRPDRRRAG
jgi:PEP-CTERM motif-containing protein